MAARVRSRQALTGYVFVLPAVALFAVMGVYTVGYGLALSFARWNGFTPYWTWVGVGNYLDLIYRDPTIAPIVQGAAVRTVVVMIAQPVLTVLISFPLAVALNRITLLRAAFRTVFFLPQVTAGIALYYAWSYALQPDGSLNFILRHLGLGTIAQPQGWLGNPATALPTLIVVAVFGAVPVAMLLYLTGLQSIDQSVIDAARVDGAGGLRTMTSVVWPLLLPITGAVVVLNLRDALQGFSQTLLMTNGGPGGHTLVLGLESYNLAFFSGLKPTLGLSSALGWILFVIALLLAAVNLRALRSRA
ncbi:carbohydrate ABC transporter permease [Kutzneria buriramensis]|uniref:Multiple sugar transport system permease protein/raffinose/stachyose/melibiose transport system permease protein n=1 Tax=Kutzneria buriramensis TaxID=1045776 RepID=A0A3E0I6C5_9PSEU|nr:sugar ABC transporter permease [Kutzneria buriramensis]REH54076.1 multiple sugar transport system permease protein/raffinose/stachyose/melibiose transport system permease protein [Kutzneria buriramensis]